MRFLVTVSSCLPIFAFLCITTIDAQPEGPAVSQSAVTPATRQDTLLARTAEAILKVLEVYDRARLNQDVDTFVGLHAPDALFCRGAGPDPRLWRIAAFSPIGRPETMNLIRRGFVEQDNTLLNYSNTTVRVDVADAAALVVRRISETYRDQRTGVERRVDGDHNVHLLVRVGNEWKIAATLVGLGNPERLQLPAAGAEATQPADAAREK